MGKGVAPSVSINGCTGAMTLFNGIGEFGGGAEEARTGAGGDRPGSVGRVAIDSFGP